MQVVPPTRNRRRRSPKIAAIAQQAGLARTFLTPDQFESTLRLERRRAERSGRQFVLMLAHLANGNAAHRQTRDAEPIMSTVATCTRETDVMGMYVDETIVGVIFTEIGQGDFATCLNTIRTRVDVALREALSLRQINDIRISYHVYPEDEGTKEKQWAADDKLYPDLFSGEVDARVFRFAKRTLDVVGSAVALVLLMPVLMCIALGIKLTSRGPVLFIQKRVGQSGKPFTFYKFRTMLWGTGAGVHQAYVKQFISGAVNGGSAKPVYKLSNDSRVTSLGHFLRRSSLDELPQFYNVLRGEMSLVGPRPPLPYELEAYSAWHRRRILEAKPGITGLWQVTGRSRTRFDEMVRLDLEYADKRSFAFDIGILARTVWTVLSGDGGY